MDRYHFLTDLLSLRRSASVTATLFTAGLAAAGIGSALLLFPAQFSAIGDIDLGGNLTLLSQTRSSGSLLLFCGVLIFAGGFVTALTRTAIILSVVLYIAYGIARVFNVWLDGMPAETLLQAPIFEWSVGLVSLLFVLRNHSITICEQ